MTSDRPAQADPMGVGPMPEGALSLVHEGFDPAEQGLREALCTLGNGRFATRGALCEVRADEDHYPGTYLAGGYDRLTSEVSGRPIENEDLVNWPNWLGVRWRIGEGGWARPTADAVVGHRTELDLRCGVLLRETRFRDGEGRLTLLRERRLVSMAELLLAAQEVTLTPLNWSGRLTVRAGLDAGVVNAGVPRYRALAGRHLEVLALDHPGEGRARALVRTVQSRVEAAMAARIRADGGADPVPWSEGGEIGHEIAVEAREGAAARLEKVVAFVTSRDPAIASPALSADEAVANAPGFAALLAAHEAAWDELWSRFAVEVRDGTGAEQRNLNLGLFHLLQTLSPHTADLDVGAPARGWHGEAYRGHIFWDELFVFRALTLREPRLTRALLRYRLRRLPAARRLAAEAGHRGAMYPWQSGSDGREETQVLHLNPRSGRWVPDATHRQRHVGLAVAYNVWGYYRATGDLDFLIEGGAEMLAEIARFFASLAEWDEGLGRYRIRGVMGPDEFHTGYPGAAAPAGVDDNAYTNVLAAWTLTRAIDALEHLPAARRARLTERLGLDEAELALWLDVSERLHVPFLPNGLIAQFDGYDRLAELDWDDYRARYGDIHRLDRILEAEGRDVNAFQVSKQADVLMLPFLFSSGELAQLFEQLGYAFDPADIPRLVAHYDARTSYGSTLSAVVHAWVLARADRTHSWSLLRGALGADIEDAQGGTTREGIHLGAMCGAIDIVQSGYLGVEARAGSLHLDPSLPDEVRRIAVRLRYRGHDVRLEATHETLRASVDLGGTGAIALSYRGRVRRLTPGTETAFRLVPPPDRRAARGARTGAGAGGGG
jgi:alpha,alpha-trehalase